MLDAAAWVLETTSGPGPSGLKRRRVSIPRPAAGEILVRPLFGCWEGNMDHAVRQDPVNVGSLRGEDHVVLGNAGVVEVVEIGSAVTTAAPGDVGILFCNGTPDDHGYPVRIFGYDAPGTIGVLAERTVLREDQFIRVPAGPSSRLEQWAAFSLRYVTAWANWRVAWSCYQSQVPEVAPADVHVWGWGGGVAVAELLLAKAAGCQVTIVTSSTTRAKDLANLGIASVDRSVFRSASFENDFLDVVRERTGGRGVSILIDNIGAHPTASQRALGREGVLTTSGWKNRSTFPIQRATACQNRHLYVHTHYARYVEGVAAVAYAVEHGWLPQIDGPVYPNDQVPELARAYMAGEVDSYFPVFACQEQN